MTLMNTYYDNCKRSDPRRILSIEDDRRMAMLIAKYLSWLYKEVSADWKFGPEWIERRFPEELKDAVMEYVYDIEENRDDWNRFAKLHSGPNFQSADTSL